MRKRKIINFLPVPIDKRGNQQKKSALRLMEIGHQHVHYPEPEPRHNDYSRSCIKLVQPFSIQIRHYRLKRLLGREDFSEVGQWEAYTLPASFTLPEAMAALLDWFDAAGTDLLKARTTIIILPGYRYRVISAMFTNFHQPRSTLLLLVAAAIGDDWQRVYRYALDHGFRFLSYGDSSFLKIRNR